MRRRKVVYTLIGEAANVYVSHQSWRRFCFTIQVQHSFIFIIVPFIVDPNKAGRIVRRPTERDIFWDETTGRYLNPSCLLDHKSLPPLCKERWHNHLNSVIPCGREERTQRVQPQGETEQTGHWGRFTERDPSWTAERKEECKEDSGTAQLFARDVQSWGPNSIWTENTFLTNLKCLKKK